MYGLKGRRGGRRPRWKSRYNNRKARAARKHVFETDLANQQIRSDVLTVADAPFNVHTAGTDPNDRTGSSITITGIHLFLQFNFSAATPTASRIWRMLLIQSKMGDRNILSDLKFPTYTACFTEEMRTQYKVLFDKTMLVSRVDIDQRLIFRKAFKFNIWQNYAQIGSSAAQTGIIYVVMIGNAAVDGTTWDGHICKYFVNRD